MSGTLADGSPINTNVLENAGSNLFLVAGTQGPQSSADPVHDDAHDATEQKGSAEILARG